MVSFRRRQQRNATTIHHSLSVCCLMFALILVESVMGENGALQHTQSRSRVTTTSCRNSDLWSVSRGGGLTEDEDENIELDKYIEQLVASVDTSEVDEEENTATTATSEPEPEVQSEEEESEKEEESEEEEESEPETKELEEISLTVEKYAVAIDGEESVQVEVEEEEESTNTDIAAHQMDGKDKEVEEIGTEEEVRKRSKRKIKRTNSKLDPPVQSSDTGVASQVASSTQEDAPPPPVVMPYRRPNAVYRFLLGQGRIGHVLVMACVMLVEWIQTYFPTMVNFASWILLKLGFGGGDSSIVRSYEDDERIGVQGKVNAQYAAFVSTDGSTVRGKQLKKLAKQADQKAVEQLRRVGSVKEAKYRHVSLDFMKRHGIGPYRRDGSSSGGDAFLDEVVSSHAIMKREPTEEEESDVDWVVEALSTEPTQEQQTIFGNGDISVKPSVAMEVGSRGPSFSVGVEFGLGSTSLKKKRKRRKSVVEAATEKQTPVKAAAGPRASDRDGGGGIVGRLRSAVGSNIPSSLLGAYPGDAVPASEAGSADGVIVLARKYGYGDWSDSDDEDEEVKRRRKKKVRSVSSGGTRVSSSTKRRKKNVRKTSSGSTSSTNQRQRSNTKRRKSSHKKTSARQYARQWHEGEMSSGKGSSFSVGFGFSSGSDGLSSARRTLSVSHPRKRENADGYHRSTTEKQNTSSRSTSTVELLTRTQDADQRKRIATEEKLVRLPMERTNEALRDNND